MIRRLAAGETVSPPPASCWYHFPPQAATPSEQADAHLRHLEMFELDFLKVMNEVGYPREELGHAGVVRSVVDLRRLRVHSGDAGVFQGQLEMIRLLAERINRRVAMTTTIFHAWMVLRSLTAPPKDTHRPPLIDVQGDPRDETLTRLLAADVGAVRGALEVIGESLASFAVACVAAGADGIYLATREDWVDTAQNRAAVQRSPEDSDGITDVYDMLAAQPDRRVLEGAARGWFNWVHLCGRPLNFGRLLDYEHVHVVHWADRVTGPAMSDATRLASAFKTSPGIEKGKIRRVVLAGGVNNLDTLPEGSSEQVAAEVREAVAAVGDHPLIVAPGCTYAPEAVPVANLRAMFAAARTSRHD